MTTREASRQNWTSSDTDSHIKIGALQRIADATEQMAKNYVRLQADLDMYKRWYNEGLERRTGLERKISALKGVITKLKKKTQ